MLNSVLQRQSSREGERQKPWEAENESTRDSILQRPSPTETGRSRECLGETQRPVAVETVSMLDSVLQKRSSREGERQRPWEAENEST